MIISSIAIVKSSPLTVHGILRSLRVYWKVQRIFMNKVWFIAISSQVISFWGCLNLHVIDNAIIGDHHRAVAAVTIITMDFHSIRCVPRKANYVIVCGMKSGYPRLVISDLQQLSCSSNNNKRNH